jgi:hypothetical protein
MGRTHQHQVAYRSTGICKSSSRKACRQKTYTPHTLAQALQAYHQICQTRQQHTKSMRQVAADFSIPFSTFQEHVYKFIAYMQPIRQTANTIGPPTPTPAAASLPHNTDPNNSNTNNLTHIHNSHHMQRINTNTEEAYVSQTSHAGCPTILSTVQEQYLKQYISEMADIGLPLTKTDVIRVASHYATQLGIKINTNHAQFSCQWWRGTPAVAPPPPPAHTHPD